MAKVKEEKTTGCAALTDLRSEYTVTASTVSNQQSTLDQSVADIQTLQSELSQEVELRTELQTQVSDRKRVRHSYKADTPGYFSFELNSLQKGEIITITDQYGGCIELLGTGFASTENPDYQKVRCIRKSYGIWKKDSTIADVDDTNAAHKLRAIYFDQGTNHIFVSVGNYTAISVEGIYSDLQFVETLPDTARLVPQEFAIAQYDKNGKDIADTYATKDELSGAAFGKIEDGGYSTTALDVNSEGKVVKVKLAANLLGAAEALEANVTRYTSELNPILQRDKNDSNFVFQVDTNTFLPMVYDDATDRVTATIPNGDAADVYSTCSHLDNIYYIKGSEYLKYNFTDGTTTVVAQVDGSKTYRSAAIIGGKVLNEDIPAYYCANDNKMYSLLDGSELVVSFIINSVDEVPTVYADKNGKTYKGIVSTDTSFNSILDEGQGVLFEVAGEPDGDGKGYAVNCPAAIIDIDSGRLGPFNGGQPVDVAESSLFLYRLVKDGVRVATGIGFIYAYNEGDSYAALYPSTIYNYGYFAGFEYITTTPYTEKLLEVSTENIFVAKDVPVEINGKYFVDGRWYDKVVTSYEEFMQFVVDTEKNYVSTNNYPKYFDVLYNNAGTELIPNNPWRTAANALNRKVKHFYRLIGLRSNMNGDGYFGSDSMTENGSWGEVRDIESIFTFEQNFDFFAPPSVLNGNLLYENIEFRYVNGFFKSSKVTDLKNCNIFIEGEWTNAQNKVTFEHCEDVYFTADAVNFSTGEARYYNFNSCNGMFVDTLIGSFQPEIAINLSTMLLIKCTSNKVTQYGPGTNAHYAVTGTTGSGNVVIGRKEITLN